MYYKIRNDAEKEIENNIKILGSLAAQDFERTVDNNIQSLEALAQRIIESEGAFFKYLPRDSKRIIAQNPALKFIEFIDSTGVIREVYPTKENNQVVGLDITPIAYRYNDWRRQSKKNKINITNWTALTQGGKAFLIDVPLYYNNRFQGTISAGMDFEVQFDELSRKLEDYAIIIRDDQQNIFYSFNDPMPGMFDDNKIYNTQLKVDNLENSVWSFQFLYRDKKVLAERNIIQDYALLLGLLLSILSSFMVLFYLKAKSESKRFKKVNFRLNQTNQLLEEQKDLADTASLAKTQFLSNMSHEIRTPLSAILGLTEILKTKNLSGEEKEYIQLMYQSSKLLLSLVNDILDIDKIESGKMELSREQFSPRILFKNIINTFKHAIEDKGLEVKTKIDSSTQVNLVLGDSSKMAQIYTNIVANALKFTQKGYIEFKYGESIENGRLLIKTSISDSGIGIPKNKIPVIFDRFTQVENGLKKRHGGGGLGLAITKELISVMGGSIKVKSKFNKGTKFSIELSFPLSEQSYIGTDLSEKDLSHLKILIVDDNMLNRIVLKKMLEQINITPMLTENGHSALELTNESNYDLIFMDVHMPELNGFEVTKTIREKNKEIIIFGLSADVTKESIKEGIASGMNEYLTKPLEKSKLYKMLLDYFS